MTDAGVRLGAAEALALARAASRIIVARGRKLIAFDMKRDAPDDDTLLSHMLGPTGNLRAPTLRVGKTILIGFNEDAYNEVL